MFKQLCPTCRAPSGPARRCFVEAECPVCLNVCSTPSVLSCGHVVCATDLATLGIATEQPSKLAKKARAALNVIQQYLPVVLLVYLSWDGGGPVQGVHTAFRALDDWLLTQFRLASWRHDRLCNGPCYSTRESAQHTCENDCDCDGARTCSFFGYCVGASGECDAAAAGRAIWHLDASVVAGSAAAYPGDAVPSVAEATGDSPRTDAAFIVVRLRGATFIRERNATAAEPPPPSNPHEIHERWVGRWPMVRPMVDRRHDRSAG